MFKRICLVAEAPETVFNDVSSFDRFYMHHLFWVQIVATNANIGNQYIPLAPELNDLECIINPKNKDEKCIKYAIIAGLHHENFTQGKNKGEMLHYNKYTIKDEDIEYPVGINNECLNIKRLEKQNNINIKVFIYDNIKKFPCMVYKGQNKKDNKTINLMLVETYCDQQTYDRVKSGELTVDEIYFNTMPLEKQIIYAFNLQKNEIPTTVKDRKTIPSVTALKDIAISRINKECGTKHAAKDFKKVWNEYIDKKNLGVRQYGNINTDVCINTHWVCVKDMNVLRSNLSPDESKKSYMWCDNCGLYKTDNKQQMSEHTSRCENFEPSIITMPKEGEFIQFKNIKKMVAVDRCVYADIECILEKSDIDKGCNSKLVQIHRDCGAGCVLVNKGKLDWDYSTLGEHSVYRYLHELTKKCKSITEEMRKIKEINMTPEDIKHFEAQTTCYLCKNEFKKMVDKIVFKKGNKYNGYKYSDIINDEQCMAWVREYKSKIYVQVKKFINGGYENKVRDHDHETGAYRGAACSKCNVLYRKEDFIPVVYHNGRGYDFKIVIQNIGKFIKDQENKYKEQGREFNYRFESIMQTKERFLSYSIITPNYRLKLIDSLNFFGPGSSLDSLSKNLPNDKKTITYEYFKNYQTENQKNNNINREYSHEKIMSLVCRKIPFCYEWLDSFDKINHEQLPDMEHFKAKCGKDKCMKRNYGVVNEIFNAFDCKNFSEYLNLYMMIDIVLLADIFENYRKLTIETYRVDPTHYYSAPGLFWDAMLMYVGEEYKKDTGEDFKLDLLSDSEMYMFFENMVVGGISTVSGQRIAKANNPYLPNYNPKEKKSYILYGDINNMYGGDYGMSGPLPMNNFFWEKSETQDDKFIKSYDYINNNIGYRFRVPSIST